MRSKPLRVLFLATALSFGWTLPSFTQAAPQRSSPAGVEILSIGTILITVGDMERSLDFYSHVLTFEKVSDTELAGDDVEHLFGVFGARVRVVRMKLGDESVELVQFLAPQGRSIPVDSRSNDLWFQHIAVIVTDMDRAYQVLRQNKVEHASSGPQRLPDWNKNAGGIKAFYFKDPDEHPIEILKFPEGKGDPKWHRGTDRLFLGIDHTAIAVSDTDTSLKFYRDLLGLRELLEYLSPRDGRPFPVDEHANDLVHRETILLTTDADAAALRLNAARVKFVSSGVVVNHMEKLDFSKAFLVRDPDGHAIEIAAQ